MWEEPDRKSFRLAKFLMGKVFSSISRCFLPGLILQIMAMSITDLVSLITYYYCHVYWLTKWLFLLSRISPFQHEWKWWWALQVCVLMHITLGFKFYPIALSVLLRFCGQWRSINVNVQIHLGKPHHQCWNNIWVYVWIPTQSFFNFFFF